MVSGSRAQGGAQVLSAGVRKTIQTIKEIVGNHSDADIYVALQETNMDPNETAQKLLNQDPFHEVKRRRDRKKENPVQKGYVAEEPKKKNDVAHVPVKYNTYPGHSSRRGNIGRNAASGASREFRVVRDNRVNQTSTTDSNPGQNLLPPTPGMISSGSIKSNSEPQEPSVGHCSSKAVKSNPDSQPMQTKDAASVGNERKEMVGEKCFPVPSSASRLQTKANVSQAHSANSSSSSVVGVYSSSSDPVHVPSLHSRPAANIGAIRREVGVVGPRRQSSDNSPKPSASQGTSLPNAQSGRDGQLQESVRSFNAITKNENSSQHVAPDSSVPGHLANRTFSSNAYGSRPHQLMGHQKAPQHNKEWKPKASLKPIASGSGVTGVPAKTVSPPADNPEDTKKGASSLQDNMSEVNISENQNVIIAPHIRVSETDRCRLKFGSLGSELGASANSVAAAANNAEAISTEPSGSASVSVAETSADEPAANKQLHTVDDSVRNSGSNSPASGVSDEQPTEKKESTSPQNLNDYADVDLLQGNSRSYTPESLQQRDASELPNFSGYDPQMAYDMSYFRPADETARGPTLPSSQEVLGVHTTNALPVSTIAMVQQQQQQQHQQQQLAQMYPQLHVSHFANIMPYRQFLSPVYVPPMPVPGYSNSPAYPHPSNGSSYLLMPGNSSHITPNGVKYGIQQFKTVPTGSPTGFGNFTSPAGYAINTPGVVASTTGHDDSSRVKYKDNLYVPNPQAETSEIWVNQRDVSGLPSSYYNFPGQAPHPTAYLTSHSGHASYNAAAAVAQSSHMQFQGMYHPSPQQPITSPHHLGGNVGVGVAAAPPPGPQVGAYQQPQMGHLNWTEIMECCIEG